MSEEYREYQRKKPLHPPNNPKKHKIIKKLLQQFIIAAMLFVFTLGCKTLSPAKQVNTFLKTAMTKPVNTEYFRKLIGKYFSIAQNTKEGSKYENTSNFEQTP